jgi:hypothetical protein
MKIEIEYEKLKQAILRNPTIVRDRTNVFLVRSQAILKQNINQSPWRIGGRGGGSPVLSGNLKKSHEYQLFPFSLRVTVNEEKSPYAKFVHEGTRKLQSRPWLRYAEIQSEGRINNYAQSLLKEITEDLGK